MVELIEAATRGGQQEPAANALELLSETTRPSGTPWARGIEARSRALLAEGEAAETLYREAIRADAPARRPRLGRLLELPRRRHLRLPGQLADRLLLRDRHRADRQPRPRGDDGRLRHARPRPGDVLPALPDPGRPLARESARGSRSGRRTSAWRGCASPPCCRSGSCSCTSP